MFKNFIEFLGFLLGVLLFSAVCILLGYLLAGQSDLGVFISLLFAGLGTIGYLKIIGHL